MCNSNLLGLFKFIKTVNTNLFFLFFLWIAPIGGGVVYFQIKKFKSKLKYIFSFGASFLFSFIFLHIMPELFIQNVWAGSIFLLGFYLQIILGVCGAVSHCHTHKKKAFLQMSIFSFSLFLHAWMDGLLLGCHDYHHSLNSSLFWAIIIHKVPVAFVLSAFLDKKGFAKNWNFIALSIFGVASPMAIYFTHMGIAQGFFSSFHIMMLETFAAGCMLHTCSSILLEECHSKNITVRFIQGLGFILAWLLY